MSVAIITGSAGLIGSEAATFFVERGLTVVGIDNDLRRELFGADDGFRYQKEYVGAWRFVAQHGDEVWRRVASFSHQLFSAL